MNNQVFQLHDITNKNLNDARRFLDQHIQATKDPSHSFNSSISILRKKEADQALTTTIDGFRRILAYDDEISGAIIAQKSTWDSEHFGFGVGKIRSLTISETLKTPKARKARDHLIKDCIDWMEQKEVKCIITRTNLENPDDINAYEHNQFHLADVLVTFCAKKNSHQSPVSSPNEAITIRPYHTGDQKELMKIASSAFSHDHFHRDSRFPREKSDELFARWAYNSCHGLADLVLVAAGNETKPYGFITCKTEQLQNDLKYGIIDLFAVSPLQQGKRIGTQLAKAALDWFSQRVDSVFVGTQADNIASIRTYEKVGFNMLRTELTYHKWLDEKFAVSQEAKRRKTK
jgi:ribosomal protein S18 acetylase RimI-like enzyme